MPEYLPWQTVDALGHPCGGLQPCNNAASCRERAATSVFP